MTLIPVGGSVDEVGVCFAVYGPDLDPDAVTALLGCSPTSSHRRGDRRGTRSPPSEGGAWLLTARGRAPTTVEELIDNVLHDVTHEEAAVQKLRRSFTVQLRVALHLGGFNEGFELSTRVIARLAVICVPLVFDIYADLERP